MPVSNVPSGDPQISHLCNLDEGKHIGDVDQECVRGFSTCQNFVDCPDR